MDPADAADGKRRTQAWMGSAEEPPAPPAPSRSLRWVPASVPASASTPVPPSVPASLPSYPQGRAAGAIVAGRYRLVRELGQGTLTETWEATHIELGRDVAIKFLRHTEVSEQMVEEARAIARIRHPHLVEFSDIGRTEQGQTFVVMELLVGQSIEQVLARQRVIPWARSVAILRQISEALGAAHQHGVVHRDLRPGNVFLLDTLAGMGDSRDFVKIVDFGLARAAMPGATWTYASPEQCRGEPLDPRSDVYAMGCLLFAMITGDPPFVGDPQHVLWQQQHETPKALHERAPRQFIPTELEAIVARCLAKHPAQRFADGRELAAELGALAQFALASTLGVAAQDPSASGARPMGFAGRPAPQNARELTNSYKPVNQPIIDDDEPDDSPPPVVPSSNVRASAPANVPANAGMSAPAIVAITLAGVITVAAVGVGMYWLVNRLIRTADQTEQREVPSPAPGLEVERSPQPAVPQSAVEQTSAQAKNAAPAEVPVPVGPAPAPEDTEKPAKKQANKSSEPKSSPEAVPDQQPAPEPASEPKKSKPSVDPDSKAKGKIGHDELLDPWD
jgi:serine/threonine protein kinase